MTAFSQCESSSKIGDPDHQEGGNLLGRREGKPKHIAGDDVDKHQDEHDSQHETDENPIDVHE